MLNSPTYSALVTLEIIFPVKFLTHNTIGADLRIWHKKIDLLSPNNAPLEECQNFLFSNPNANNKDKNENGNEHPVRCNMSIMPIIITNSHLDKITFTAAAGTLAFENVNDKLPILLMF